MRFKRGSYKMKKLCNHIVWNKFIAKYMCNQHRALDMTLLPCPYTEMKMPEDERKAYVKKVCADWKEVQQ